MRAKLRTMVRGAYDLQKLRIQTGNRIAGNFKVKLGQDPGSKEDDLEIDAKLILVNLRQRYKRITDGLTRLPSYRNFKGDDVIDSYTEFCLVSQYVELLSSEELQFRRLTSVLRDFDIWTQFLVDVKGVGPAMAGVLISEIDISKAKYPSSIHKYAGLDVADDGAGRSRRKEHLVDVEYVNKEGEIATKKGITFNPFLKTKLVGVLATSFLRQQGDYAEIYNGYKHRLACSPKHQDKSKGHRHHMAVRYMIKMFLIDLHSIWRSIEGYPATAPYHEAKLDLYHKAS